jgi:hypothetical protein
MSSSSRCCRCTTTSARDPISLLRPFSLSGRQAVCAPLTACQTCFATTEILVCKRLRCTPGADSLSAPMRLFAKTRMEIVQEQIYVLQNVRANHAAAGVPAGCSRSACECCSCTRFTSRIHQFANIGMSAELRASNAAGSSCSVLILRNSDKGATCLRLFNQTARRPASDAPRTSLPKSSPT